MELWATYGEPTLTLLLISVTLCRRCFCSLPGSSCLHPRWTPSVLLGDGGGHSILRPLPLHQIGLELAGGLRTY